MADHPILKRRPINQPIPQDMLRRKMEAQVAQSKGVASPSSKDAKILSKPEILTSPVTESPYVTKQPEVPQPVVHQPAKTFQEAIMPARKLSFLDKPVLDTMEDYQRFEIYCKRPGLTDAQRECTVTPEIYDLLSEGYPSPFLHIGCAKVFNSETKEEVKEKVIGRRLDMVIPR